MPSCPEPLEPYPSHLLPCLHVPQPHLPIIRARRDVPLVRGRRNGPHAVLEIEKCALGAHGGEEPDGDRAVAGTLHCYGAIAAGRDGEVSDIAFVTCGFHGGEGWRVSCVLLAVVDVQ